MSDLKKSLMQIADIVRDLNRAAFEAEGLITPEIEAMLEVKDLDLPDKVDNYAHMLKKLPMEREYLRGQIEWLQGVIKVLDRSEERLKENMKLGMEKMATNEVRGHNFKFKMAKAKASVVIEDETKLEGKYLITVPASTRPDKNLIAKTLESGGSVEGARLEGQASLRIYPLGGTASLRIFPNKEN